VSATVADPKQLASLLSEEEELRRFNAAQGEQPWYSKALPMEGRATFLPFRDTMEGSVFNKRELALPGILAGALNAFTSPARALTGSDPTFKPGEEAANMALNTFGGGIATGKALTNPTGIGGTDLALNVYHGTPNQIKGNFDLSKVGTGEGAQAFGHGIYFAENPKVAEGYRKRLSGGTDPITYEYKGQQFLDPQMVEGRAFDPVGHAVRLTYHQGAPTARQVAKEGLRASAAKEPYALEMGGAEYYQKMLDTAKSINRKDIKGTQGFLYKADIPDEQIPMMLDWNKPFNQQNPEIQALLKDKSNFFGDRNVGEALGRANRNKLFGGDLVGKNEATPKEISEYFNSIGITGIRYFDSGSRGIKKGTTNFVSFRPETVEILERNSKPTRKDLLQQEFDKLDK
jgi:hypothetical protein